MGISYSSSTRFLASRTPDEEEGESPGYPNLQKQYESYGERSLKKFLSFSSIYKATKCLLLKVCLVFNYLRPRKTADPLLPIQNPASKALAEPLLVPTPLICSRRISNDSSSDSLSKIIDLSVVDDEEAQRRQESVVSAAATRYASYDEIVEEVAPANSSRSKEAKEQVKSSIAVVDEERRIKHYSSRHKILLVGEGDFSFSACLAVAFGSAANIIATSLNSKAFLKKHYGNALSNIAELRSRGSTVMHGIDATEIANHELLRKLKFDRIIFNFPYAGFFPKLSTECQLRRHRKLVSQFLKNAMKMISENGEIHISHKTNGFHAEFKLENIASSHGLRLIEAVKFKCSHYPGYNTKYGFGGDTNFDCNPSKTFKFGLKTLPL